MALLGGVVLSWVCTHLAWSPHGTDLIRSQPLFVQTGCAGARAARYVLPSVMFGLIQPFLLFQLQTHLRQLQQFTHAHVLFVS